MTADANIIVLDDEPAICNVVERCLRPGGFRTQSAHRSTDLWRLLNREAFDLVILDLNLGGEDGLSVLSDLQKKTSLPTIILTSRGEAIDRVVGLEMGADDYIAKPFEPRELLARVRTVLRRTRKVAGGEGLPRGQRLWFEGFLLDPGVRTLRDPHGNKVALTTAEFEILHVLAVHPNRPLSRAQILSLARSREANAFDRSVDVHVGRLRRKLEPDPGDPRIIKTLHGIGYVFSTPVETRPNHR